MYKVLSSPSFVRDYRKLTDELQRHADRRILRLSTDPHHPSLRTHKRRGEGEIWQARVTKNHRLYFSMSGDTIVLLGIGAHEK